MQPEPVGYRQVEVHLEVHFKEGCRGRYFEKCAKKRASTPGPAEKRAQKRASTLGPAEKRTQKRASKIPPTEKSQLCRIRLVLTPTNYRCT